MSTPCALCGEQLATIEIYQPTLETDVYRVLRVLDMDAYREHLLTAHHSGVEHTTPATPSTPVRSEHHRWTDLWRVA